MALITEQPPMIMAPAAPGGSATPPAGEDTKRAEEIREVKVTARARKPVEIQEPGMRSAGELDFVLELLAYVTQGPHCGEIKCLGGAPAAGFGSLTQAARAARTASAVQGSRTVIGKIPDLKNLAAGERALLDRSPGLGSWKADWKYNASLLRTEMSIGKPIRDASVDSLGNRINNTGILRAERNLLDSHGWVYDSGTKMWYPPVGP
jgi:hypothetical protein